MATRDDAMLGNYWWVLTIRGIAALLFGFAAVFWPEITLVVLVYLFSAYILVTGVIDIVEGLISITKGGFGWLLKILLGIVELGVGVYLLRHTAVAFATLIAIIGFVLIARGVFDAVTAFVDDQTATSRALLLIGAVLCIIVGIIVLAQPAASGVAFVWILGVFALISGPLSIAMSLDVRRAAQAPARGRKRK